MTATITQLDHTADLGFRITAHSMEELFIEAARTMFNLILSPEYYNPVSETMDVRLRAENSTDLFREWLSELLYFHATRKMIFPSGKIWSLTENSIEAIAEGFQLQERHIQHATEIKAVTYHSLYLRRTNEGFEAQVIFDT